MSGQFSKHLSGIYQIKVFIELVQPASFGTNNTLLSPSAQLISINRNGYHSILQWRKQFYRDRNEEKTYPYVAWIKHGHPAIAKITRLQQKNAVFFDLYLYWVSGMVQYLSCE